MSGTGEFAPARTALLTLTVLVVAAAFVPAGAAQSPETPEEPCADIEGPQVVTFFETGERYEGATLYPGTVLTLYVCEDGGAESYGTAWQFDESQVQGLRVLDSTENHLVVSVTNRSQEAEPASAVQQKPEITGPTIGIQTGYTATERIGESSVTLRFASQADRDAFNRSVARFRTNASAAAAASENLSTREGESLLTDPSGPLSTIASADVGAAASRLERTAFEASAVTGVEPVARTVRLTTGRESRVRASVRENLRAYLSALETREQEAATTVRLVFAGTLVGGLVAGAALGYWLSRRTLWKVEADRGVSTATQYSLKHIGLPLAIGALALVVTLVVFALRGGSLFEVIL